MSDKLPFRKSSRGVPVVPSIATDAEKWVKEAAGKTNGLSIGAQILQACANLGYPRGYWRVRAAWNGEAGCWSAAALRDLEARYRAWDEKQGRLADANEMNLAALTAATASRENERHAEFRQARVQRIAAHAREAAASRRAG